MKTFRILLLTCLTATVAFTSCKKDNNTEKPDDKLELVGTWKMKEQKMEAMKDGKVVETLTEKLGVDFHNRYMQFAAGGQVTFTDGDELPVDVQKGTYTLKDDELHLVMEDEDDREELIFKVSRKGDALSLNVSLDLTDFEDVDDSFGMDYGDDVVDADVINVIMNLEKTEEDPTQVKHVILGAWNINQAEIQGLVDDEVVHSEIITVGDGLEESSYVFNADGTVTITTAGEDDDEDEVSTGTYVIDDGLVIIDLDDEDEVDYLAFAYDGQKLTLTQSNLSLEDLFDITDEFDEYESYNLILTLSK